VKQLDKLTQPPLRAELIRDCALLVESEVRSKKGISGALVKAAFATVRAFKPSIVTDAMDGLLDEFIAALAPYFTRYQEEGGAGTMEGYLSPRTAEAADSLLSITDKRADNSKHKTLVKAYHSLRPKGKVHVEQAIPAVGRLLDKHVSSLD
jgi:hypothetical protein